VTVPDTPDRPPSEGGRASVEGACAPLPDGLQLRSLLDRSGLLELSLVRVATTQPGADEVVIRVEATPINPSDIGLLFGAADLATLTVRGSGEHTVASARVPDAAMKAASVSRCRWATKAPAP
jgi:hypothetical protein